MRKTGKAVFLYFGMRRHVAFRAYVGLDDLMAIEAWLERDAGDFEENLLSGSESARSRVREMLETAAGSAPIESLPLYVIFSGSRMAHYEASSSIYFDKTRTVEPEDVAQVIRQTRSVATVPVSETVVCAYPQEYLVNDFPGVSRPAGLEGKRVGVTLQLYTLPENFSQALSELWERLGIEPDLAIPGALSSAFGVTSGEERSDGVLCADLGGRDLELNYFSNGILRHASKQTWNGGDGLTDWIARRWDISRKEASRLKEEFGIADPEGIFAQEQIPVVDENGQVRFRISLPELTGEVRRAARDSVDEVSRQIAPIIKKYGRPGRMVITGGPARMQGLIELFQSVLEIPCRAGLVKSVQGPWELVGSPVYSSAVGALKTAGVLQAFGETCESENAFKKSFETLRDWFREYF